MNGFPQLVGAAMRICCAGERFLKSVSCREAAFVAGGKASAVGVGNSFPARAGYPFLLILRDRTGTPGSEGWNVMLRKRWVEGAEEYQIEKITFFYKSRKNN